MSDDNRAIARRYYEELLDKGKLDVADEIFAPKISIHALWVNPVDAVSGAPVEASVEDTPEGMKAGVTAWRENLRGLRTTVDETINAGDKVITLWTTKGIHRNGSPVTVQGIDVIRFAGGKIVEHWDARQPVPEHPANENTMF